MKLCAVALAVALVSLPPMRSGAEEQGAGPYRKLADALAAVMKSNTAVNVGMGNFLFEDTEMMSPFSSMLREELEAALPMTGRFKVIARSRLSDLQLEGHFQQSGILEPDTTVRKVSVEGVQGIVRGRFYYRWPTVTVYAEMAWLEGAEIRKARVEMDAKTIAAQIWPNQSADAAAAKLAAAAQAPEVQKSKANVADVAGRIKEVPHDFGIELVTKDARRDYAEGELVSYRVRCDEECHIAVFCHQVDGSTTLLFPNAWNQQTLAPAGKPLEVPGTDRPGFEIVISPPFGADVVQVIACTKPSSLHRMVQDLAKTANPSNGFRSLTRGMVAQEARASVAAANAAADGGGAPARWAESHMVVCTYPKMGR
jgi:hypothetical protein